MYHIWFKLAVIIAVVLVEENIPQIIFRNATGHACSDYSPSSFRLRRPDYRAYGDGT